MRKTIKGTHQLENEAQSIPNCVQNYHTYCNTKWKCIKWKLFDSG